MSKIRWGILGTGRIAREFTEDLVHVPDCEVTAVGSRAQDTADAFGAQYNIPTRHASYQALVDDPNVDIIYVSTPHNLHYENCLQALRAGKHVLCEKAFTVNRRQAEEAINLARQKNLFIMEAMWTRFFPLTEQVLSRIAAGEIGEVRQINANFGFNKPFDPTSRLYAPELAGGALLDVGVYAISAAYFVYQGVPEKLFASTIAAPTGVDSETRILLDYADGRNAMLSCAVSLETSKDVTIAGTKGLIHIHRPFWHPTTYTLSLAGADEVNRPATEVPYTGNGMHYEAEECVQCIQAGKTESTKISHQHTLDVMDIMDRSRAHWGFMYPGEHDIFA